MILYNLLRKYLILFLCIILNSIIYIDNLEFVFFKTGSKIGLTSHI